MKMKMKMPFKKEDIRDMRIPFKKDNSRQAKAMRMGRMLRGIVGGAAVMYFLDPQMGARRRALLRDRVSKVFSSTTNRLETVTEKAADRAKDIASETAKRFNPQPVSDETLVARIHSEMGRYLTHPHAVEVMANNGHITLTGDIFAHEVQPLLTKLKSMQFVESIDNRLAAHEEDWNVTDFQTGDPQFGTP